MWAEISETVVPESLEEKQLWKERAQLEKKIERREKMIHNTQERLKCGLVGSNERETLEDESGNIKVEVEGLREEITMIDRKIRQAESKAARDGPEGEKEEAKAIELAAKRAKEYAQALGEARERMEEEAQRINDLEAKLKEVGTT